MEKLFFSFFNNTFTHPCTEGALLFCAEDETVDNYKAFLGVLEQNGYNLYADNKLGENLFSVYSDGKNTVNIYYTPCDRRIRAVVDEGVCFPPKKEQNEPLKKVDTLVTQRKLSYINGNDGMSYIIRLCDGRFVLIDSGDDYYEETEHILEVLRQQNTVYPKPVIAACFITHSHADHFYALTRLMRDYADEVVFGEFIYNWPNPDNINLDGMSDHTEFDELVRKIDGARIIHARSGQHFCYADAVFDVIWTCDDFYPANIENFNNTGTVMIMTINGRKVFWMGDAMPLIASELVKRYDEETLACEILQVPHHGYSGGSNELHRLINPETLLWSVPDCWFRHVEDWETNEFILNSEKIKNIYFSGLHQTVLNMSGVFIPPNGAPEYAVGDVIYKEDFKKDRVIDLDWCAVGGLKHIDLTLGGGCLWKGKSNIRTTVEIIKQGVMENAKSYELYISGEVLEEPELFGLIHNYTYPTKWLDEKLLAIKLKKGNFNIKFTADEALKKTVLDLGDGVRQEFPYVPEERISISLSLLGGAVLFKEIKAIKI